MTSSVVRFFHRAGPASAWSTTCHWTWSAFGFRPSIAGDQAAIAEVLGSSADAWRVSADETAKAVLETYRRNIELADAALTSRSLDMALSWWREDFFGSWRIDTVREVVLHVII